MVPFFGTTAGAAMVLMMGSHIPDHLEKLLMGSAAGVMIASAVWSLLIPSIQLSDGVLPSFIPPAIGFCGGITLFLLTDRILDRIFNKSSGTNKNKRMMMTLLAVTLHNIPEGMAVGVALAAASDTQSGVTIAAAWMLAVGIAVQNFPEGAIISMPLRSAGQSRSKAFCTGTLTGAVEPLFGFLTLLVTAYITAALPYLLSFASGAMFYVVTADLLPEVHSNRPSESATVGFAIGFVLMMSLDVAL